MLAEDLRPWADVFDIYEAGEEHVQTRVTGEQSVPSIELCRCICCRWTCHLDHAFGGTGSVERFVMWLGG